VDHVELLRVAETERLKIRVSIKDSKHLVIDLHLPVITVAKFLRIQIHTNHSCSASLKQKLLLRV
jgi:hypothetical protein